VARRINDFAIDLETREIKDNSDEMRNPAILVKVTGEGIDTEKWLFALYPDLDMKAHKTNEARRIPFKMRYNILVQQAEKAGIKAFKSTLKIIDGGTVAREKTIEVNAPLSYGGYSIYQTGYNEDDPKWTSLQVVHDPSVPVIYTGFILMIIGLLITTYRGMTA